MYPDVDWRNQWPSMSWPTRDYPLNAVGSELLYIAVRMHITLYVQSWSKVLSSM